MVKYKDELFIVTHKELEALKIHCETLLKALPKDPNTALITICFLKEMMEKQLNKKVAAIQVQ